MENIQQRASHLLTDPGSRQAHGETLWKTLKVDSEDLKMLMIVRTLPCGSMHVSVEPFHDYVRPKMPLGRWLSELKDGGSGSASAKYTARNQTKYTAIEQSQRNLLKVLQSSTQCLHSFLLLDLAPGLETFRAL